MEKQKDSQEANICSSFCNGLRGKALNMCLNSCNAATG